MAIENDKSAEQRLLNQERRFLASQRKKLLAEQARSKHKYDIYKQHIKEVRAGLGGFAEKSYNLITDITAHLDNGDDDAASEAIDKHIGLLLQQGMVEDMSDTTPKSGFDENGNACSVKDAYFVVDIGQKIVKEGDEFYLLKPGQSLNDATKDEARQHFLDSKQSILSAKVQVKQYQDKENQMHGGRIADIDARLSGNKGEKTVAGEEDREGFASQNAMKPRLNPQLNRLTENSARTSRSQMVTLAANCTNNPPVTYGQFLNRLDTVTDPGLRARIFNNIGTSQAEMQNNPGSPVAGSQKMQALIRNMALLVKIPPILLLRAW